MSHGPEPTSADASAPGSTAAHGAGVALLLILFSLGGTAMLIYEVVWLQLLALVIGSSAISLGILLGTFMAGIGLGSVLTPRLVSRRRHPLRVYAVTEVGIAVCGLLVLLVLPLIDRVYAAVGGGGIGGLVVRALIAAACLLPPTLLSGASFPLMARYLGSASRQGISRLGYFYGGNIAGGVFGSLLAGFYLLRFYDMPTATYVAAAINVVIAVLSGALARRGDYEAPRTAEPSKPRASPLARGSIYVAIALSGFTALGAEVVWTRLLSVMLGATVYTFSIILAVFLAGLGVGSGVASHLVGQTKNPRVAFVICQVLLAAAIAWTAYALADSLPNWPVDPLLAKDAVFNFQIDVLRCMWALFPAACLWGASFPLALAALGLSDSDADNAVATTYFANTIGGVCGALAFSLVLIPWVGTQNSQRVLIALAAVSGLVVVAPSARRLSSREVILTAASVVAVAWLIAIVMPVPWLAIAYGRRMILQTSPGRALYVGEGRNYSVVVSEPPDGNRYFHIAGKVEASTDPGDMRLQRMLGDIPALFHPSPKSVLVVGLGAGVTAGSFVPDPAVQNITICEVEPLVPWAAKEYFAQQNYAVMTDRRTTIRYDDARHLLLTSKTKYDVITSDPIHPWVKGTSSLYSKQYFQLVKDHLMPGGLVTQWVPLYESDAATVKTELATFFDAFPNGSVWTNTVDGRGNDLVLLGQVEPLRLDIDALQARWDSAEYARFKQSMTAVNFPDVTDILATYAGRAADLRPWLSGADINDDMNMRLQYLAGIGLNVDDPDGIYRQMLRYRRFPFDLITGSQARLRPVRDFFDAALAGPARGRRR